MVQVKVSYKYGPKGQNLPQPEIPRDLLPTQKQKVQ